MDVSVGRGMTGGPDSNTYETCVGEPGAAVQAELCGCQLLHFYFLVCRQGRERLRWA